MSNCINIEDCTCELNEVIYCNQGKLIEKIQFYCNQLYLNKTHIQYNQTIDSSIYYIILLSMLFIFIIAYISIKKCNKNNETNYYQV